MTWSCCFSCHTNECLCTYLQSYCFVLKLPGATEADLTIRTKKTQLFVCRVNDHFGKWVFSDWVKVKVVDIDKSGMHRAVLMVIHTVGLLSFLFALHTCVSLIQSYAHCLVYFKYYQVCRYTGRESHTLLLTLNPRRCGKVQNSPFAALPLASQHHVISGTKTDNRCWTKLLTRCRWGSKCLLTFVLRVIVYSVYLQFHFTNSETHTPFFNHVSHFENVVNIFSKVLIYDIVNSTTFTIREGE